jgi:DNA primase
VLLAAGLDPQVAILPDGTDPDAYIRKNGKESLLALLGRTTDFVDYVLAGRRLDAVAEQRMAVGELVQMLKLIADPTTRELYANRVADRFRLDKRSLLQGAGSARRSGADRATQGEERLVGMIVQHPDLARLARELHMSEALAEPGLQAICRLAEEHAERPGFGPGMLIDLIDDDATRRRVAGWTFIDEGQPAGSDLRQVSAKMRTVKAGWLRRLADEAYERGDTDRADALNAERSSLLGAAMAERSTRS